MASLPQDIPRPRQQPQYSHSYQGAAPQPFYGAPPQHPQVNDLRAEAGVPPVGPYPAARRPSYPPPPAQAQPSSYPPSSQSIYGHSQPYGGSSSASFQNAQYLPGQYQPQQYQPQQPSPPAHHLQDAYAQRPPLDPRDSGYSHRSSRSPSLSRPGSSYATSARRRASRSSDFGSDRSSPRHDDHRHDHHRRVHYDDHVLDDDADEDPSDVDDDHTAPTHERRRSYQDDKDERRERRYDYDERRRQRRRDELDKRPTLSDSVMLVADTLKGAISGRRD